MNDAASEVLRLACTIHELMRISQSGWITWNQVAKQHTGSTEAALYLSSVAMLPDWQHLFVVAPYKVKLSSEGLQLVSSAKEQKKSLPDDIADAVVAYACSLRPIFLSILNVAIVASTERTYVHAISVELSDELLPTETPVQIRCAGGRPVYGKLVGQEPDGDVVYIACDSEIDDSLLPTTLIIDRAYLLTQLADQVRKMPELPERMQVLFTPSPGWGIADGDSLAVAERLAELKTPWTQFLWGPPGAGKTFGLGELVASLSKRNPQERILIVAPSNRAVDVAVAQLCKRLTANKLQQLIAARKVLRFGYPRLTEVLETPELLGPATLDSLNKRVDLLARKIRALELSQGTAAELAITRASMLAAQEAVKVAVNEHVAQCSVLATTTTLAYMPNSPVAAQRWDTVIIDEVTMVPPVVCAYLASKAKRRFLLAGDPCQLGPVHESRAATENDMQKWLNNDVFTLGGVSSGRLSPEAINLLDSRMARITAQRRCVTDIWDRVTHLYPHVLNLSDAASLQPIASVPPAPLYPVTLVDLSSVKSKCEKMRHSWQNVTSAEVAMRVATTIASSGATDLRVAIICPYRAQVKMLRQWIRNDQKSGDNRLGSMSVDAGTVHQFQGSEADIVIFDLVDGPGRRNLGVLLQGDAGTRLVNVAISRARGKLIVIADREWCRAANISNHNQLLSQLVLRGSAMRTITPKHLLEWQS